MCARATAASWRRVSLLARAATLAGALSNLTDVDFGSFNGTVRRLTHVFAVALIDVFAVALIDVLVVSLLVRCVRPGWVCD